MGLPAKPDVFERLVMFADARTEKLAPLLFTPLANTTTLPVVAPDGTAVAMLVEFQLVMLAVVPLNETVPLPWVAPNPEPVIVTTAPAAPDRRDKVVIAGVGSTVKLLPELDAASTVTTTLPVVARAGTMAAMLVLLQLVTVAATPLTVTVLLPWLDPKFVPATVTETPAAPDVGDKLVMVGVRKPVCAKLTE